MCEQPPCFERGWHRMTVRSLTNGGWAGLCLDCGEFCEGPAGSDVTGDADELRLPVTR